MPKTCYIWDGDNIAEEVDENGNTIVEYTYKSAQYGELISQRRWDGAAWQTRVHHYDALGSTIALTDETGAVTDTYEYDAWGNPISVTGSTENPFRWVGKLGYYWDEELGSYYVRERNYEALIARWLSKDSLGMTYYESNLYRYVSNHALIEIDPSGNIAIIALAPPAQSTLISWQKAECNRRAAVLWNFILDKETPCDGYFVQYIRSYSLSHDCQRNVIPRGGKDELWEAFNVYKKGTFPSDDGKQAQTGLTRGWTDSFQINILPNTCGYQVWSVELRFYCKEANVVKGGNTGTGNLDRFDPNINPTWGPQHPHTGVVSSSQKEPDFWGKAPLETGHKRSVFLYWQCCAQNRFAFGRLAKA